MGEPRGDSNIHFGVFELDARSGELRKAGTRLKLQDQPLKVLTALLQQPGELVTREELKRQIWPADSFGDFDHGVNTAVAKLRAALGDSSDTPRFIETLPRRGYRFIYPVSRSGDLAAVTPTEASGATENKASKRRRITVLAVATLMLGLVTSAWWLFSREKRVLTEKDTIVLADFTNKTGDPIFSGTLKEALATTLSQSPFFNILSEERLTQTLRMMERTPDEIVTPEIAREVCQRTGTTVVVAGSIANLGNRYALGLNATDCVTGDSLARESAQAERKEDVMNALDNAARGLRASLGESAASIRKFDAPIIDVTTPSLEAMRIFAAFVHSGGTAPGVPMLQHALKLDPNFAMADKAMSDIYSDAGDTELASEYAQKAYERRERATERERLDIESTYYFATLGDMDQEMGVYAVWKRLYPRDAGPRINSSEDQRIFGNYEAALNEARQAVSLAPQAYMPYVDLTSAFLALDRRSEASQAGQSALAHGLDMPDFHLLFYRLAFLDNNAKEMEAEMKLLISGGGPLRGALAESSTEAFFGRQRASLAASNQALEIASSQHMKELAAEVRAVEGLREAEFGNVEPARRVAAEALTMSSGRRARAFVSLLLARAGDAKGARALVEELNREFPSDTLLQKYWLPTIRASMELALENPSKALGELQPLSYELGDTGLVTGNLYPVYIRGQAYLEAERGTEAATEFRTILDRRSIVLNSPLGALSYVGLGRAYALQARMSQGADVEVARERARTAYKEFLALWRDADPGIPILKQAKAEYARLQ